MPSTTFAKSVAIEEGTTALYTCTLTDPSGAAINPVAVSAITATLIDQRTGTVINSRSAQSVLNTNGGTLAAGAVFTLVLSAADTAATAGDTSAYHPRLLTLKVTYADGTINHEVLFWVQNLRSVS